MCQPLYCLYILSIFGISKKKKKSRDHAFPLWLVVDDHVGKRLSVTRGSRGTGLIKIKRVSVLILPRIKSVHSGRVENNEGLPIECFDRLQFAFRSCSLKGNPCQSMSRFMSLLLDICRSANERYAVDSELWNKKTPGLVKGGNPKCLSIGGLLRSPILS